jgi:transcriptional regulator with XRE-family HTH domain
MTDISQLLGANIKYYRKSCSLTQEKLAEKVNTATNYISAIEAGRRFPSVEMLKKIALALEIDTPKLFVMENMNLETLKKELEEQLWLDIGQNLSAYVSKRLDVLKKQTSSGTNRAKRLKGD